MKQTAVEWLEEQLIQNKELISLDFEQAKEMEKQQMGALFAMGMVNGINIDFEQFYKETYESKTNL
jgi:hypothetical protein